MKENTSKHTFWDGIRKKLIGVMGGIDTPRFGIDEIMGLFRRIKGPDLSAGEGAIEALTIVGAKLTFREEILEAIEKMEGHIASIRDNVQISNKAREERIKELKNAIDQLKAEIASYEIFAEKETMSLRRRIRKSRKVLKFFFGKRL